MPAKRGLVNHWRSSATSLSKSIVLSLAGCCEAGGPEAGRRAAARRFLVHGAFRVPSQTVPRACLHGRLDPEALFAELEAALAAGDARPEESARSLSTAALIARIVDRHHGYLRQALPYVVTRTGAPRPDRAGPRSAPGSHPTGRPRRPRSRAR